MCSHDIRRRLRWRRFQQHYSIRRILTVSTGCISILGSFDMKTRLSSCFPRGRPCPVLAIPINNESERFAPDVLRLPVRVVKCRMSSDLV
ncbi:hypothetical protein BJX62DRAFT_214552 [Aspergillus germanicus]